MRSNLPLEDIIFDGDAFWRQELLDDELLQPFLFPDEADEENDEEFDIFDAPAQGSFRREMLREGIKLDRTIAGDVHRALDLVRERLQLNAKIELYCIPEAGMNALVAEPENQRIIIGLTSDLITLLAPEELAFIIGHEIGHVLMGHFSIPWEGILENEELPPIYAARFYAWSRYAELSADRVGLLACASIKDAVRASFKISSNLTDERFVQHAHKLLEQYDDISLEGSESQEVDWFNTHPYGPLRLKALSLFSRSHVYLDLAHQDHENPISEQNLEQEVARIMDLMDPTFLDSESPSHDDILSFLSASGILVAGADGRFLRQEHHILRGLVPDSDLSYYRNMDEESLLDLIHSSAQRISLHLSVERRCKLLEDLYLIAQADSEVSIEEEDVLALCAELLSIPPEMLYTLGGDFYLD